MSSMSTTSPPVRRNEPTQTPDSDESSGQGEMAATQNVFDDITPPNVVGRPEGAIDPSNRASHVTSVAEADGKSNRDGASAPSPKSPEQNMDVGKQDPNSKNPTTKGNEGQERESVINEENTLPQRADPPADSTRPAQPETSSTTGSVNQSAVSTLDHHAQPTDSSPGNKIIKLQPRCPSPNEHSREREVPPENKAGSTSTTPSIPNPSRRESAEDNHKVDEKGHISSIVDGEKTTPGSGVDSGVPFVEKQINANPAAGRSGQSNSEPFPTDATAPRQVTFDADTGVVKEGKDTQTDSVDVEAPGLDSRERTDAEQGMNEEVPKITSKDPMADGEPREKTTNKEDTTMLARNANHTSSKTEITPSEVLSNDSVKTSTGTITTPESVNQLTNPPIVSDIAEPRTEYANPDKKILQEGKEPGMGKKSPADGAGPSANPIAVPTSPEPENTRQGNEGEQAASRSMLSTGDQVCEKRCTKTDSQSGTRASSHPSEGTGAPVHHSPPSQQKDSLRSDSDPKLDAPSPMPSAGTVPAIPVTDRPIQDVNEPSPNNSTALSMVCPNPGERPPESEGDEGEGETNSRAEVTATTPERDAQGNRSSVVDATLDQPGTPNVLKKGGKDSSDDRNPVERLGAISEANVSERDKGKEPDDDGDKEKGMMDGQEVQKPAFTTASTFAQRWFPSFC
ncbi:hypothetical protein PM082_002129 [Marasmius tenuissimus]|nr:hypothetical protein PM082_002129 [Marasmius tenuissimus]